MSASTSDRGMAREVCLALERVSAALYLMQIPDVSPERERRIQRALVDAVREVQEPYQMIADREVL